MSYNVVDLKFQPTVVATTKKNANVALIFVFLHKLVQVRFCLKCSTW